MKNVFISKDGRHMCAPETKEESIRLGFPTYYVFGRCEVCQWSINHQIYIDNGACKSCLLKEAIATKIMYNHLTGRSQAPDIINMEEQYVWVQPNIGGNVKPWQVPANVWERIMDNVIMAMGDNDFSVENIPCKNGGHVLIKHQGKCYFCKQKSSPRQVAIANNEKWYIPDTPCPRCNTTAMRYVTNGRCSKCHPVRGQTNRMKARDAGEKWYKPEEECPKCGNHALRYVANGRCKGCNDSEELQRLRK